MAKWKPSAEVTDEQRAWRELYNEIQYELPLHRARHNIKRGKQAAAIVERSIIVAEEKQFIEKKGITL